MNQIKKFYDTNNFPGPYTMESLQEFYYPCIDNPYLRLIETVVSGSKTVLDIGCGTGLITNLMALKFPRSRFTALDFSTAVDFATDFANRNSIDNATFVKQDFSHYDTAQKFDVVICQGVLHHMPNWQHNIDKIKQLVHGHGTLVLGLYHPMGKVAKRFLNIEYASPVLYADQEQNPFELTFDQQQVNCMLGDEFTLVNSYPTQFALGIKSLFNYRNGGLVTYIYRKKNIPL